MNMTSTEDSGSSLQEIHTRQMLKCQLQRIPLKASWHWIACLKRTHRHAHVVPIFIGQILSRLLSKSLVDGPERALLDMGKIRAHARVCVDVRRGEDLH